MKANANLKLPLAVMAGLVLSLEAVSGAVVISHFSPALLTGRDHDLNGDGANDLRLVRSDLITHGMDGGGGFITTQSLYGNGLLELLVNDAASIYAEVILLDSETTVSDSTAAGQWRGGTQYGGSPWRQMVSLGTVWGGSTTTLRPPWSDPVGDLSDGLLGFRLWESDGWHYGIMRAEFYQTVYGPGDVVDFYYPWLQITALAYETTPNTPISANAVPEPGRVSLITLALLLGLRRRRRALAGG
jgi:hypothetical protein